MEEQILERVWSVSPDTIYGVVLMLLTIAITILWRDNILLRKKVFLYLAKTLEVKIATNAALTNINEELKKLKTEDDGKP